MSYIYHPQTDG